MQTIWVVFKPVIQSLQSESMWYVNPIQGIFGTAHGWADSLPKICQTYPKMMKLGTVIPYLKKI